MNNNGHQLLGRGMNLAALRKTITVKIPGQDYAVRLRELSIAQINGIENDLTQQLALMIVDETGERVFTTEEDLKNLEEMSAGAATFLLKQAAELNGATKEAIETVLKNSVASRSVGSDGA